MNGSYFSLGSPFLQLWQRISNLNLFDNKKEYSQFNKRHNKWIIVSLRAALLMLLMLLMRATSFSGLFPFFILEKSTSVSDRTSLRSFASANTCVLISKFLFFVWFFIENLERCWYLVHHAYGSIRWLRWTLFDLVREKLTVILDSLIQVKSFVQH